MASPSMRVTAQTSSFQQQMRAMVESMKRVSSEYKLSATQAKLAGDSAGVYKAKIVELTEKIKLQKQSIESQEKHLTTQQERMDKLTEKNAQLKEEVEKLSTAYEKNKSELGENNEATKLAKEELEKKQEALKKNEQAITSQSLAIDKSTTKLNESKAGLIQYEQELDDANISLKKVEAGLDDTGKEMQESGQKAVTFGDLLKSSVAADLIVAGLRKIKDAIIDVSKAALHVGMDFESSMSQVAATMGFTVEQIQNGDESFRKLEDAAKKCGEETQFSASEAAEALNYLALAGYDVDKSVETLPTVLNLAAAGGMDLASASDMVTDSMSALGDVAGTTESFVDKMAKTSQKSNTNVSQLGEAILTVGGTAKVLNGGVTEMNTALGILADNGIKGSEGGTALRNIILALTAPTDKSAKAIKQLGLDVYDASGKLRPMNEIFQDLDGKLSKMTDGEKTQVLNTIFNKVDLKSANALLANSGKRFDELSGYIDDSTGAAENMAATLNNNVKGKITIFQSGLEGLGIAIYDKFKQPIGDAIDSVTKNVSDMTTSIKNGALDGVFDGIAKNFATLVTGVTDFANAALPMVIDGFKWISENGEIIKSVLLGIGVGFAVFKVAGLITTVVQAFNALRTAVLMHQLVNQGATVAQSLFNVAFMACPLAWIAAGIGIVVAAITLLWQKNEGFRNFFINAWENIKGGLSSFIDFVKGNWQGVLLFLANPILGGFKLAYDNCTEFRTKVNQILNTVIGFVKNNWASLLLLLVNPIAGGFNLAYDNCTGFRTKVNQVLNTVINFVKNNWASILLFLINPFAGLFTYFYNNNGKFRDFVNNAYNSLKELPGKIWSAIQGGITNVKKFGTQLLSSGKNAATQLKNGVVNGAKSIPTQMKTIGKNIIDGVWNGIKNAKVQFTKNIKGFFGGIVDSAKEALDIHSPSKRSEKEIGEEFAEGGIKGIRNKYAKAKLTAAEYAQIIYDSAKTRLDTYKKYNDMSLTAEVAYWNKIVQSMKKGTQGYKDALLEYKTVRDNLNEQIKKAEDDYASKVSSVKENLIKDIQAVTDKYDDAIKSRANSITQSMSLFDAFSSTTEKSAADLLTNLEGQVQALYDWDTALRTLGSREGMNTGLLEELQSMGVSALADIQTLVAMTDEELTKYVQLWEGKNQLANNRALVEYAQFRTECAEEIQSLVKTADQELNQLEKDYNASLKELGATTKETSVKVGAGIVTGLKEGIESENAGFQSYLTSFFDGIMSSASNAIKAVNTAIQEVSVPLVNPITELNQLSQVEAINSNINTQQYTDDSTINVTVYTSNTTTLDNKVIAKEVKKEVVNGITKDKNDYNLAKGVC